MILKEGVQRDIKYGKEIGKEGIVLEEMFQPKREPESKVENPHKIPLIKEVVDLVVEVLETRQTDGSNKDTKEEEVEIKKLYNQV
jgi:hypothetical protein